MRQDRRAKQLARLEEARRLTQQRLEQQRRRVEARFDRLHQRITGDEQTPNDDQQRIITAALELLDEVGLNDLSLRKLADKLDMKAPALYWHFKNKDDLIDYMAEAILQTEFQTITPRRADEAWQDWLVSLFGRLRKAMRAHRDGGRVVAGAHLYPAVTLIKIFEASMQSLISAGVERRRANLVIMTATHFVFGNIIEDQAAPSAEEMEQANIEVFAQDYPLFAQNVRQFMEDYATGHDDFEDSLRLIIR